MKLNKIFLAFLLLTTFVFSLEIDYQNTAIFPKYPKSGQNAIILMCLRNEQYPQILTDLQIDIEAPSCISLQKTHYETDEVGTNYCFPINIKIGDCENRVQWLKLKTTYYTPQSKVEKDLFYTFILDTSPNIYIQNYSVSNNYLGNKATLRVFLKNSGENAYDVLVTIANSTCFVNKYSYFIQELGKNEKYELEIPVNIPSFPLDRCNIVLSATYKDSLNNIYNKLFPISFPVYTSTTKIIASIQNITVKPNTYDDLKIKLKNTGDLLASNILVRVSNAKGIHFLQNEEFIKYLEPGYSKTIEFPFYVESKTSGTFSIPIIIAYTDKFGNRYNTTAFATIQVNSEPNLSIYTYLEGQDLNIVVYNTGNIKAEGVVVKISCVGCILNKNEEFIGEIDSDDYNSAVFSIYPLNKTIKLKIDLYYKDALGNHYKKTFNSTIKIQNKYNSNNVVIYIILAVIVGIIIFAVKRRQR